MARIGSLEAVLDAAVGKGLVGCALSLRRGGREVSDKSAGEGVTSTGGVIHVFERKTGHGEEAIVTRHQDPVLAAPEPYGNDPAPLFASEEDLSNISDPTVDEIDGPTPEELDDEALEQEPEQNSTGKEIVHKIKDFVPGKNKLAVEISADPAAAPPEVTVIPTENGLGSQIFVGGWLVVVLEDLPDVAPSDIILETVSQATGSNQNPHGEG